MKYLGNIVSLSKEDDGQVTRRLFDRRRKMGTVDGWNKAEDSSREFVTS